MNWYFTAIEIVTYLFIYIMARHLVYRSRFFLHTLQLSGYKGREFWKWLKEHWSTHLITVEHACFNLVILVSLLYLVDQLTSTAVVVIVTLFAAFWFGSAKKWIADKPKKPLVLTPRATRLGVTYTILTAQLPIWGTAIAFAFGVHFPDIHILAFAWILADILAPFLFFPALALMSPVEWYIQNGFKNQARKKIASMPNLSIIGITGSYGKTSTKFIIREILKERFNVCFTPGSFNTPMGICKVINQDLNSSHQILILEMGARYKGNIAELCQIAQPDVAVVTNVGVAHLETFGSVENIASTKSEILAGLPSDGTAILNAEDKKVMNMKVPDGAKVITAGLNSGNFTASEITYNENGCNFIVHSPLGESVSVTTSLLGSHNVLNVLLGFAVGHSYGMRLKTMAIAASAIQPVEHRMEMKRRNGITIIDDAFNSNPIGAKNAIETLGQFKTGRRILITPGIVELGDKEEEENHKLGYAIHNADLDRVYLVGKRQTAPIYLGLEECGFDMGRVVVVNSLFEANDNLQDFLKDGDIVLYENDLPDTYNE